MKKYLKLALVFLIIGALGGVFYREFTKFMIPDYLVFARTTSLAFVHVHFLVLGFILSLVFALLNKVLDIKLSKLNKVGFILFIVGLSLTGFMMLLRGSFEVQGIYNYYLSYPRGEMIIQGDWLKYAFTENSKAVSSAFAGVSGIGHVLLGTSIVLLVLDFLKQSKEK